MSLPAKCASSGCDRPRWRREWCRAHYKQWLKTGVVPSGPVRLLAKPEEERFWEKVKKTETCWLWTATTTNKYGLFSARVNGVQKTIVAHRYAYISTGGSIPEGYELDHLCRNRSCVNPDHLEPVTRRENVLRSEAPSAINARKTHCIHGHEFTPENTRIRSDGGRRCRECKRLNDSTDHAKARISAAKKKWYQANRERALAAMRRYDAKRRSLRESA